MKALKVCLLWVVLCVCPGSLAANTYDLERDYSDTSNPAGPWSYGWKQTVTGPFTLMGFHGSSGGLDYWLVSATQVPSVYHNGTTNTIISNMGQGIFPPGVVWMGPGWEGTGLNFSVIRFTATVSGIYELKVAVKAVLDGSLSGDSDFHVLHNDVELFGQNVPANGAAGYTNAFEVAAGDTIDFVTGRGPDDRESGSGLKIKALLTVLEEQESVPRILQPPSDQSVFVGADVTFAVQATGSAPLSYQWSRNDTEIPGATGSSLTLTSVQLSQAGSYAVRVSNSAGSTSAVATLTVYEATTHDLERDYSSTSNPAGVWSYGFKVAPGSTFNLMAFHYFTPEGIDYWLAGAARVPSVYHNGSTNTIISNLGQGIYPPGVVWMGPGYDGTPEQYSVIRFTAPVSGLYDLRAAVKSVLEGNLSSDADFHVVHNGVELFGQNVLPNASGGYTNRALELAAGDTIDFMTGRGADGRESGSGLKIKAYLNLLEERVSPPRILQGPGSVTVFVGATVSFTVRVTGSAPLEYQWFYDDTELPGATEATLVLSDLQVSNSGAYSVRVSNAAGSATSSPAILTVQPPSTYDLERDYSETSNPAGEWSYGWKEILAGAFNLMGFHGYSEGLDYWLVSSSQVPSVYHNGTTNTIISNLGQGIFPPGVVWMGPGWEGTGLNYSVIRFTAPLSGLYNVQAAVRSVLDGDLSGDADFHVLHNGVELFGQNVPGNSASGYTNTFVIRAGDAIEFVTGRGDDGRESGSGLKIKAYFNLLEVAPSAHVTLTPSVAFRADESTRYVISGNAVDAQITLDGRGSVDPDGDPLSYAWFVAGSEVPFSESDVTVQTAALGVHAITLVVDDGVVSDAATISFAVITPAEAVREISEILDETPLSNGVIRPLQAALEPVINSLGQGKIERAVEQLRSFQLKVESRLGETGPELAEHLIGLAEHVIHAIASANSAN